MTYAATANWLRARMWVGAVVGAVPWVVWLGSLAIGGWYKDAEGTLVGADHLAFYTAAHLVHDGQQGRMYDYNYLSEQGYERSLIGWNWNGFEAYRNPPFYALLYLPTAGLSFYTSFLIWTGVGVALLALSIFLLRPERPRRAFLWALAFYPVFAAISFGQNTLISLAVFAGVYRLLNTNRPLAAGLVAGLLWFKPQLLLGFFVWWAIYPRRYARCWLGVGMSGLALAALSWGVLPEASQAFVDSLRTNVGFGGESYWNKHSPRAFWAMLFTHPTEDKRPEALIPAIACSLIAIGMAWLVARRTGAPVAVMFPVAVFLSLWASPHSLIYEWALLFAAGIVLWERLPEQRDVWLCIFALTWITLAVSTVVAKVQIDLQFVVVLQPSIPVMAVVGWLAARELMARGHLERSNEQSVAAPFVRATNAVESASG